MTKKVEVNRTETVNVVQMGSVLFIGVISKANGVFTLKQPRLLVISPGPVEGTVAVDISDMIGKPQQMDLHLLNFIKYEPEQEMVDMYFNNVTGIEIMRAASLVGSHSITKQSPY